MPRTRVHNLFVSLDGYAAGEEVTFDAPIGRARQFFSWFDGPLIHGVDQVNDRVTVDLALFSTWARASAPRSWDGASSARIPACGPTTDDSAGGATNRRSTHRCS